jgi:thymidylate synthase ThyX
MQTDSEYKATAKILLDSVAPNGQRLTTWELEYARFVHAELMTHRVFSRSSASSRAIPTRKLMQRIVDNPVLPHVWGQNQAGMQAKEEMPEDKRMIARLKWLRGMEQMTELALELNELGVHKQLANRVAEPWMFIKVIVSSTSYDNWIFLRDGLMAQPEIAMLAHQMHVMYEREDTIVARQQTEWHMPYILPSEVEQYGGYTDPTGVLRKWSVARVARVSYLNHDGAIDSHADAALWEKLSSAGHWAPFEHVAKSMHADLGSYRSGNFEGWEQYRKHFPNESGVDQEKVRARRIRYAEKFFGLTEQDILALPF